VQALKADVHVEKKQAQFGRMRAMRTALFTCAAVVQKRRRPTERFRAVEQTKWLNTAIARVRRPKQKPSKKITDEQRNDFHRVLFYFFPDVLLE